MVQGRNFEMTRNEFFIRLNSIRQKHPMLGRNGDMTLNELVYMLRMEDDDWCISDNIGGCIPSVKETFIPTRWLGKKIKSIDWDEEANEVSDTNVIYINYK